MVKTTALTFSILLLLGASAAFTGLKQIEQQQEILVLSEYSENAFREGDISKALTHAMDALEKGDALLFEEGNTAPAQKALTDALNVYDLSDGFKSYGTVTLPSAPLCLRISPEGNTAAILYDKEFAVFDTTEMRVLFTLPAEPSALSQIEYLAEDRIVYAREGGISVFDLETGSTVWTGRPATTITVSADRSKIAAVYKDESIATIYSAKDGKLIREVDFAGKRQSVTANDAFANPENNLLALNADGSWLGVSFDDGSLSIYDLQGTNEDIEIFDNTSGFTHFEGGFSGNYFAFSGAKIGNSVFAVIDMESLTQTGGFSSDSWFGVQADESGIYVQTENILVKLHPVTGEQIPLVTTAEHIRRFAREDEYTVISTSSGCSFYDKDANLITLNENLLNKGLLQLAGNHALIAAIDTPDIQIMSLENHADTQIFSYDPSYLHDEARISADGETIMLFSYDKFRLYHKNGEIIADMTILDAEQIYDQQYRRNEKGSYLEVIYNDGLRRLYSAMDGRIIEEYAGEQPDLSLCEEFTTDTLRIESPLHGTPAAYDKESGRLVKNLEQDDYLTYVTQIDEYIVTEYITAKGERYGLLLNEKCETLAYLPDLCDIVDGELIFDYQSGDLRKTRIYHINELKETAQKILMKEEGK